MTVVEAAARPWEGVDAQLSVMGYLVCLAHHTRLCPKADVFVDHVPNELLTRDLCCRPSKTLLHLIKDSPA